MSSKDLNDSVQSGPELENISLDEDDNNAAKMSENERADSGTRQTDVSATNASAASESAQQGGVGDGQSDADALGRHLDGSSSDEDGDDHGAAASNRGRAGADRQASTSKNSMENTETSVTGSGADKAVGGTAATGGAVPPSSGAAVASPAGANAPVVKIIEARKEVPDGLQQAYIVYTMQVRVGGGTAHTLERRYSDFAWLRERLVERHAGTLVPPLPEKQIINRFNTEFVEDRRFDLEQFAQRVVRHAVLSHDSLTKAFVARGDQLWEAARKEWEAARARSGGGGGSGAITSLWSGLSTLTAQVGSSLGEMVGARSVASAVASATGVAPDDNTILASLTGGGSGGEQEPDPWFDSKQSLIEALEAHLTQMAEATRRLYVARAHLDTALQEVAAASAQLGRTEAERDAAAAAQFSALADCFSSQSTYTATNREAERLHFQRPCAYYVRMVAELRAMLARRQRQLRQYRIELDVLTDLQESLDAVRGSVGEPDALRQRDEQEARVEEAGDLFETLSAQCRREIEQFEREKAAEVRAMLRSLTLSNVDAANSVAGEWKRLLIELDRSGDSNKT